MEKLHTRLRQYFFLHYHVTFEVKFSLVPEGAVRQVVLAGCRINSKLFGYSFVMGPPFVSSGFRGFSFRIWHNGLF